jgi:hypothetical protein
MKNIMRGMGAAALVLLSIAVACSKDDTLTAPEPSGVAALREALAPYSSFALAKEAGYSTAITDCMSNGDLGAMGVHYANTALLDGAADPLQPEALIYEPGTNGDANLVGVEFIIPYAALPKTSPAPQLFGQAFSQNDVFGVWALHVWTHRANPSGMFAPWNPRVHC